MSHDNRKKKRDNLPLGILIILLVLAASFVLFLVATKNPELRDALTDRLGNEARHSLIDTTWTWKRTELPSGAVIAGPGGEAFVLTFQSDGRLTSTTDCNSVFGEFATSGNDIQVGPLASTNMYCGPASLETQYADELSRAASFSIMGGELRLHLHDDSGTMYFSRTR